MWRARWLVWNLVPQFIGLVLSPKNITESFCRTTTSSYAKERYAVVGEWGWLRIWAALQLLLKIWPVNKTENLGGKRENRWAQFSSLRAFPFSTGFSQYLLYTYLIFCRIFRKTYYSKHFVFFWEDATRTFFADMNKFCRLN